MPVYLGKVAYKYSASSQAFCENKVFEGFGLLFSLSIKEGPLVKTLHAYSEITLLFLLMEAAIRKAKRVLSFSNNPRVTFLNTSFVIFSVKFYNLSAKFLPLSAWSIEIFKIFSTYCREYWYILSIRARSLMMKNKIDPLVATPRYSNLTSAIYSYTFLLSIIWDLMDSAASWDSLNV